MACVLTVSLKTPRFLNFLWVSFRRVKNWICEVASNQLNDSCSLVEIFFSLLKYKASHGQLKQRMDYIFILIEYFLIQYHRLHTCWIPMSWQIIFSRPKNSQSMKQFSRLFSLRSDLSLHRAIKISHSSGHFQTYTTWSALTASPYTLLHLKQSICIHSILKILLNEQNRIISWIPFL